MLTEREILRLANEAYSDFSTDFLIDCKLFVVPFKKFLVIAEKSELIQDMLKNKLYNSVKDIPIPALVVHGESEKIYLCKPIIDRLSGKMAKEKQKMFIKAITLHELYHIINKSKLREHNLYNFIKSEKRSNQEFKEDYPELANILEEVKRRTK